MTAACPAKRPSWRFSTDDCPRAAGRRRGAPVVLHGVRRVAAWVAADIAHPSRAPGHEGQPVHRRPAARPRSAATRSWGRRARRHGRGLRRLPPRPRPPHRPEGRARAGSAGSAARGRACCARPAPSRGSRTRTSSPSTTPARRRSRLHRDGVRRRADDRPVAARGAARPGARSSTCSSPPGAGLAAAHAAEHRPPRLQAAERA